MSDEPNTNSGMDLYKNLQRKTPDQIATWFLLEDEFGKTTIFAMNEDKFFEWKNGYYQIMDEKIIERMLWNHVMSLKIRRLCPESTSVSATSIKNLYETLKLAHKKVEYATDTPYIGFNDGYCLNLSTLKLEEAAMGLPIFYGLNFPSSTVSSNTECPIFMRFLRTTLIHKDLKTPDEELIYFVQELFGYCLTNSIAAHAAFFLYGSGRNGKSVLIDVLRMIVGKKFISNMSIQTLTTQRFSVANLVGKKLNIASEEESKFIKCDVFKSLVAGDTMTVERKYRDPFEYRPNVKFVFATNKIPVFDSTDVAIRDRVFIIPFNRYFSEEERDRDLSKKLEQEAGAILGWALEGAKRVVSNKFRFTTPQSVQKMTEEFQREQSSVLTFIDEFYIITGNPDDYSSKRQMYEDYSNWCNENGRKRKSASNFFTDFINVYRDKINTNARIVYMGKQARVVTGVEKKDDDEG